MARVNRRGMILLVAAGLLAASICWPGTTTSSAAAVTCHGKPVTMIITADEDDQVHDGTDGADVVLLDGSAWQSFYAKGGDDTICVEGYGGEVIAGAGDDWVSGAQADDRVSVQGGTGDDTITGSPGDDTIYGSAGADTIRGLNGDDELYPDQTDLDHDQVTEDAADTVDGGAGDDAIGASMLASARSTGGDRFLGGSGKDTLIIDGVRTLLDTANGSLRAASGGPTDHFGGIRSYAMWTEAVVEGSNRPEFFNLGGDDSRLSAAGGADEIIVGGADAVIDAGSGDDRIDYRADGKAGRLRLGPGNDTLLLEAGRDVEVDGGPGNDMFKVLTHGEVEDEPVATGSITARLRGQSGVDSLAWDCKSTVNVARYRLRCTHRVAKVAFSGMQIYRAGAGWSWKDTFRGGPRGDVFYGGGRDDTMYGGKGSDKLIGGTGHDTADGGPGKDTCRAEERVNC